MHLLLDFRPHWTVEGGGYLLIITPSILTLYSNARSIVGLTINSGQSSAKLNLIVELHLDISGIIMWVIIDAYKNITKKTFEYLTS